MAGASAIVDRPPDMVPDPGLVLPLINQSGCGALQDEARVHRGRQASARIHVEKHLAPRGRSTPGGRLRWFWGDVCTDEAKVATDSESQTGYGRFVFNGFSEIFIDQRWCKATPTFNRELCERFGVRPLEFDGRSDALFPEYAGDGS